MDAGDRFEALEIKAAYQEESLAKLNGEVWDLSRRMDRLEDLVTELRRKLAEAEGSEPGAPADRRPPHY
ncbi:MAG TPA: SlyX family protein [Spirochaetia bacterium]|nr:SlyX family protein [Spirochaetales bacterium]HRY80912.1 SlyX family protein [Spirochaetia bacterium]